MKMIFDSTHRKHSIEVTEEEIKQLKSIKENLYTYFNDYIQIEREEIDLSISGHLTAQSKKNELYNLRYHIVNELDFNEEYKDVVYFKNGFVEFASNEQFLFFCKCL